MKETFLLTSERAERLFREYAEKLPVIDYHNHLSVADLQKDRRFGDITELWLAPDPYKHRLMRMSGVAERFITGDAGNREKFDAWCKVFPGLVGTPVYHWSRMELERAFGIGLLPSEATAETIWNETKKQLDTREDLSARGLLRMFGVEKAAPCASVTDDTSVFSPGEGIVPSLRGDNIVSPTAAFLESVAEKSGTDVGTLDGFAKALDVLTERFHNAGCRFSDHALDNGFRYLADDGRNEARYQAVRGGKTLAENDRVALTSHILRLLGALYAKRGWTMQLHIGAERFTSTRLRNAAGAAGGFAGIGAGADISSLCRLLDDIDLGEYRLPRTVLFTLNPADHAAMSVLSGSFSRDGVEGLVTEGPAWWWCDHLPGIRETLENVAAFGSLNQFVGMTTDSRSLLSFVRHEYFRRVFCSFLAEKAERGEYPGDEETLARLIRRVCYANAAARFDVTVL